MSQPLKKLKIGIITNQELASWFGIHPGTLSAKKKEKLKQLEAYADFEQIGNKQKKIKINKIYEQTYHKKGSQAFETIKNKFDETWSQDGLDSCKRVCYQILQTTQLAIAESTAYNYTLKSRNVLYGKPFQNGGSLGNCRYVWCKQEEDGKLRYLTQEQEKIKHFLIQKYFGDATQKQIIVQGMVESGEISKEQAWDVLTQMTNMKGNNFLDFLKELQNNIGCKVIRGTFIERLEAKTSESAECAF